MPRVYKSKNIQTTPENAGAKNISEEYVASHQDNKPVEGLMQACTDLFKISCQKTKRGANWTPEELADELANYFQFCADRNMKPAKCGIQLFLGMSDATYYDWQNKPEKYGELSSLINYANKTIESQYVDKIEQYPTGNIFLLKARYSYQDTSKVEVTSTGISSEELADAVKKLGLDK